MKHKLYTKSQVDEMMNIECIKCHNILEELNISNGELIRENKQLKAKLKEQAKEIFDDIDKVYGTRSYPDIRKKWVSKE